MYIHVCIRTTVGSRPTVNLGVFVSSTAILFSVTDCVRKVYGSRPRIRCILRENDKLVSRKINVCIMRIENDFSTMLVPLLYKLNLCVYSQMSEILYSFYYDWEGFLHKHNTFLFFIVRFIFCNAFHSNSI